MMDELKRVRDGLSQLFKDYEQLARQTGQSYHARLQGLAEALDIIGTIIEGRPDDVLIEWQEVFEEDKWLAGK